MIQIRKCCTSGLSDKDWCEQHSISISTFYNKISKFRKKACDIPVVQNHIMHEPQQVIPIEILDESPLLHTNQNDSKLTVYNPALFLNIHGSSIKISSHAAKETIINTLSALQ